jgi:hypothetical protein
LLLFRDESKLLQQAQNVVAFPLLDYLAVFEAVDGDAFDLYLLASRGAELLYLSLVSAAPRLASDYLVTIGQDVLNGEGEVGESGEVRGVVVLGFL